MRVTKQEAFHQLRSQQQLGYIVFLTTSSDLTVRNVAFILQSTAYPAAVLEQRCEQFLAAAQKLLENMSEAEFQQHVSSILQSNTEHHRCSETGLLTFQKIEEAKLVQTLAFRWVERITCCTADTLQNILAKYILTAFPKG